MSDSVVIVCKEHAPKPGKYTGQDPASFVGKSVKIAFAAVHPISGKDTLEHMWVKVIEVDAGTYLHGQLNSDPILLTKGDFQLGSEVGFKVEEIEEVYETPAPQDN